MKKTNKVFWIITISIFILAIIPILIKDGMFMDGQIYACVSKNLANGKGTFWHPYLSASWSTGGVNYFLEHPPLVYGIQSLYFKLFRNSMYSERAYSLSTAIISAFIIVLLWNLIFKENREYKKMSWLPVLIWITIPICSWSYQNNLQENTMGIFTLSSVFFLIKAIQKQLSTIYIIISGCCIFLATFSKGLPGIFPLTVIFIYWLIFRNFSFKKMILYSFVLISILALVYFIFMLNKTANEVLKFYFTKRLLFRIHENPTVSSHIYILLRLLFELIPTILISLVVYFYSHKKYKYIYLDEKQRKYAFLFVLIGLSGSVPLMLTLVQRSFYLLPSMPFFSVAIALLISPYIKSILFSDKLQSKIIYPISLLILFISVIYCSLQIGKTGRDFDILHDVYAFSKYIPEDSTVGLETSLCENFQLQLYLLRYFNINADLSELNHHMYYITNKEYKGLVFNKYFEIPIKTNKYILFKLK